MYTYILVPTFITLGTLRLLLLKYIDRHHLDIIYLQALLLFFSQFICIFAYLIRNRKTGYRFHPKTLYLFINASLDICSSLLVYKGIEMITLSEYQLIKSIIIPITMFLSGAFLNRTYNSIEILGVIIILFGIYFSTIGDSSRTGSDSDTDPLIGSIYIACAQIINSILLVFEETIVKTWDIDFFYMIGIEGFIGTTAILLWMYFNNAMDDFSKAFDAISQDLIMIPMIISMIFIIGIDGYLGLTITKQFSANFRTIIDIVKMILISVLSVYLGYEDKLSTEKIYSFCIVFVGLIMYKCGNTIKRPPVISERLSESLREPLLPEPMDYSPV